MCQTSAASAGARDFVVSDYRFLKSLNPNFPFLVREAKTDTSPYMIARFGAS